MKLEFLSFLLFFQKYEKWERDRKQIKIKESTEPYPTPIFIQKKREVKLFYKYCVFLPIK